MKLNGKKYWIIGASEGLGRELAIQLSNLGVELVVSARNKVRLDELNLRTKAEVISLDVLDINSVRKAFKAVGKIDGIVYAAGDYTPMNSTSWNTWRGDNGDYSDDDDECSSFSSSSSSFSLSSIDGDSEYELLDNSASNTFRRQPQKVSDNIAITTSPSISSLASTTS